MNETSERAAEWTSERVRKSRKRSANVDRKKESETKRIQKEEGESEQNIALWPRYRCVCALSVSNILFTLLCKIMAYLSIHNTVKTHTRIRTLCGVMPIEQWLCFAHGSSAFCCCCCCFYSKQTSIQTGVFFIIFAFFCSRFEDQKVSVLQP